MSQEQLKAVARNGNINISGTVQVPNPSYKATLSPQVTRDGLGDLTLDRNSDGGIAIQVIRSVEVSLTIPDAGQKRLTVERRYNGQSVGTFNITVDR